MHLQRNIRRRDIYKTQPPLSTNTTGKQKGSVNASYYVTSASKWIIHADRPKVHWDEICVGGEHPKCIGMVSIESQGCARLNSIHQSRVKLMHIEKG